MSALEEYVRERIEKDTVTHARISEELKRSHPGVCGLDLSMRSIQCFCQEKQISKSSKLPQAVLELAVKNAVLKVICMYAYLTIHSIYVRVI